MNRSLYQKGCSCAGWGCLLPCLLVTVLLVKPADLTVLIGMPFVAYLVVRLIAVAWVRTSMFRTAGRVLGEQAQPIDSEESPPKQPLRFQEYDAASDLSLDPGKAALLEEAVAGGRESWIHFRRAAWITLVLVLGVAYLWTRLLPFGLPGERGIIWILWFFVTIQVGLLLLITRTTYSVLQRVPAHFLGFCLLAAGVGMGWILSAGGWGAFAYVAAIAAGAFLAVRGYRRLRLRQQARVNRALLILRVFGADANTAFTFGEVARRWRFLGSIATIADPSYIRFQSSLASRVNRRYLGMSVAIFLAWTMTVATLSAFLLEPLTSMRAYAVSEAFGWIGRANLAGFLTSAVLGGALLIFLRLRIGRNFSGTLAQRDSGAVAWDGVFRQSALYCHDDVWKIAVASLLPASHAVLMDLRGFAAERKGCEYELGLLIDTFPVDRVLLLTDRGTDRSILFALLQDRWSKMKRDSPNQALDEPVLSVYAQGTEDPDDVQRILLLLASRLPAMPPQAGTPLALPAVKAPRKLRREWSEFFGRLDLRLSQPSVAVWIAAAFLALLLYRGYVLTQSVNNAWRAFTSPKIQRVVTLAETAAQAPEPVSGPPKPFAASGYVWTNKPVEGANQGSLIEDLAVCIRFEGGPVESATRIAGIERLTMLGPAGEVLPADDVEPKSARDFEMARQRSQGAVRPWPNDKKGEAAVRPGRLELCVAAHPEPLVREISEVRGRVRFDYFSPGQRIVVGDLESLLPGRGWVRLTHPALDTLGSLELIRFGANEDIEVRFRGDLDRFEVRAQLPDGNEVPRQEAGSSTAGFARITVQAYNVADTLLEIRLGTPRQQSFELALSHLPVLVPTRSRRERFLDRTKALEYEGQPDPWANFKREWKRQRLIQWD